MTKSGRRPISKKHPFEDGESVDAAIARQGEGGGPRSLRKAERPDYEPERTGPKGHSRAY